MSKRQLTKDEIYNQLTDEVRLILQSSIIPNPWELSEEPEQVAKSILNHILSRGGELK